MPRQSPPGNAIASNGDEGVHFGSGSGDNDFLDNAVFDNYREQIYLLASHGNRLIGNTSYGSGSNSLYLKDSDDNRLENNTFRDRTARVTGDAKGNTFVNNSFVGRDLAVSGLRGESEPHSRKQLGHRSDR